MVHLGSVMKQTRLLFASSVPKCKQKQQVPLNQRWACLELRSGDLVTAKRLIREALTKDKRKVGAKIDEETGNFGLVGLISRRGIE
mmetsp:Transcript_29800/g.48908  ORF Transcript_29800/g.48908 Transcript_29800/m.48908 type:complete len:86 (+) Transcript_29800:837-1094(+)